MEESSLDRRLWLIGLVVLAGTLYAALDGRFYWHDVRFLYANTEFAFSDILRGEFNPHQAWTPVDESGASGFYVSKLLHMFILHTVLGVAGPQEGGVEIAVGIVAGMMLVTVLASFFLFRQLFGSRDQAAIAILFLCLAPVVPYLTGKLLSETSSLMFVVLSVLMFGYSLRENANGNVLLAAISGIFMALAFMCRMDSVIGVAGFIAASLFVPLFTADRVRVLRHAVVALFCALLVVTSTAIIAGVDVGGVWEYFRAFVGAGQKSMAMSFLGISTFGGVVFLPALAGLFSERIPERRFLLLWFLSTFVPMAMLTASYMVEPRYLVQSVVPLCGLAVLGLYRIAGIDDRLRIPSWFLVLAVLAVVLNTVLVKTMPYELDRRAMHQAVDSIMSAQPDAVITVPWSYTDFNYLKLMLPADKVFNVNSYVGDLENDEVRAIWEVRFRKWYGSQYISDYSGLENHLKNGPVYYLGWRYYPPLQNVRSMAGNIGLDYLVDFLENFKMKNHLEQSWVWHSKDLQLDLEGGAGQYEYFRVALADMKL